MAESCSHFVKLLAECLKRTRQLESQAPNAEPITVALNPPVTGTTTENKSAFIIGFNFSAGLVRFKEYLASALNCNDTATEVARVDTPDERQFTLVSLNHTLPTQPVIMNRNRTLESTFAK